MFIQRFMTPTTLWSAAGILKACYTFGSGSISSFRTSAWGWSSPARSRVLIHQFQNHGLQLWHIVVPAPVPHEFTGFEGDFPPLTKNFKGIYKRRVNISSPTHLATNRQPTPTVGVLHTSPNGILHQPSVQIGFHARPCLSDSCRPKTK